MENKINTQYVCCPKCGANETHLEVRFEAHVSEKYAKRYIYCLLCTTTIWEKDIL